MGLPELTITGPPDVPAPPPVSGGGVARRALFGRLSGAERVVQISAPAGSGKTVLTRSWIAEAGLGDRVAWVTVDNQERDPRRFWISVADALRGTAPGAALVRPLTAAPDLDCWAVVERLLTDLAPLADRLRLAGELTEVRANDLRFTLAEARALFGAAGVQVPAGALARLHDRTEGWAAGVRVAALSLAGHTDPDRFAAEFSGSERTVADYLLAEGLDRQTEEVRRRRVRP